MTKINYYQWASENLSESRARAFKNALRDIDSEKFSPEWAEARKNAEQMVRDHAVAHANEIADIEAQAKLEMDALKQQIAELEAKLSAVREARDEAVMSVRISVYSSEEYTKLDDLASALWRRDDEAAEPKRQALMAKYAAAQAKVSA